MFMVTRPIRVLPYHEKLSRINSLDLQWGVHMRSQDKLNTLYLHLQKTHGHQTGQSADLMWETPILKAAWPFNHVTNVTSSGNWNNYISTITRLTEVNQSWCQIMGGVSNCFSKELLKLSPNSCFSC